MIVKLENKQAELYKAFLEIYRNLTQKEPTYKERTEAFFAARNNRNPYWI